MNENERPNSNGSAKASGAVMSLPLSLEEDGSSINTTRNDRNKRFASLFLGNLGQPAEPQVEAVVLTTRSSKQTSSERNGIGNSVVAESATILEETTNSGSHLSQLDGVLSQIDQLVPHDPIALRQTVLYKGALSLIQYQRDNYLVGSDHANRRQTERQTATTAPLRKHHSLSPFYTVASTRAVRRPAWYDSATSMAHGHLVPLVSGFVPTRTVQTALIPLLTSLVDVPRPTRDGGALYDVIRSATISVIAEQQAMLELTIKSQLLQFLDNPSNRQAMKSSTQGLLIQTTLSPTERVETNAPMDSTTTSTNQ